MAISASGLRANVYRLLDQVLETGDPFDRLISGGALADGARLLTADPTIRADLPRAVWE